MRRSGLLKAEVEIISNELEQLGENKLGDLPPELLGPHKSTRVCVQIFSFVWTGAKAQYLVVYK